MLVLTMEVRLYAPWVHSLKEKRMEVKSLLAKVRNKFNVSAAEIGDQDLHQSIRLGFASVAADTAQADSIADNLLRFLESASEAELVGVQRELR